MKRWLLLVIALVIVVIGFMYMRRAGAMETQQVLEKNLSEAQAKVDAIKKNIEELRKKVEELEKKNASTEEINRAKAEVTKAFEAEIVANKELTKAQTTFIAQGYSIKHIANALYDVERGL